MKVGKVSNRMQRRISCMEALVGLYIMPGILNQNYLEWAQSGKFQINCRIKFSFLAQQKQQISDNYCDK